MIPGLFDTLDKAEQDSDELISAGEPFLTCDGCDNEIGTPVHQFIHGDNDSVDLCPTCWVDPKVLSGLFTFELIDRMDKTEETNPRRWPCIGCGLKLGWGYKWYLAKHKVSYGESILDICSNCWNRFQIAEMGLRSFFEFYDNNYLYCQRGMPGVLIDVSDVKDTRNLDLLAPEVRKEITMERNDEWAERISSLVALGPSSAKFGPVKRWCQFTDFYSIPSYSAETALLVECDSNGINRVASIVCDDHGRHAANVIFNNWQEYRQAYEEWLITTRLNCESDEYKELLKKVETDIREKYSSDDDEHARICTEFSAYIRIKKDLSLYYG